MHNRPLAFSYLRFSTPEQQRGDSFRRQKELAERYAQDHGLTLDGRSFMDLGVSAFRGANLEVGMLGAFREAVKLGTVPKGSYLLVESLDRLSRNIPRKATRVLEDICEEDIKVVTLTDNRVYDLETINRDPMALMFAYVVAIRAHEESERKAHNLRSVWHQKRRNAKQRPMTAIAPGWLSLSEDRSGFDVIDDRVETVRRIFADFLTGEGTHAIAQGLNSEGVSPFGRARFWHRSYVLKILDNPATIGEFTPHTMEHVGGRRVRKPQTPIPDYYPAVISPETFARAKAMRSAKRGPSVKAGSRRVSHLLAALARCPHCRSSMIRVNKGTTPRGGHPYLICSRAKAGAGCQYHSVRVDLIEPTIIDNVEAIARSMPQGSRTVADAEKKLAKEREQLEKRMEGFLKFLEDGPADTVREELLKCEARVAEVREQERELSALKASRSIISQKVRLEELHGLLASSAVDYAAANAVLRQLFSHVYVHWDLDRLDFHWQHGGVSRLRCSLGGKASQ